MDQTTDPEPTNTLSEGLSAAGVDAHSPLPAGVTRSGPCPPDAERSRQPRWRPLRHIVCGIVFAASVALLASMVLVPSIAPYHIRIRGVYLTLAPLTTGYLLGCACPVAGRQRVRLVLLWSALVLLVAITPRLRHDLAPVLLYPTLAGGVVATVGFVRLGLLQAGISWGGDHAEELTIPHWTAAFAYVFAWSWLIATVVNPRETFAPTRWLLKATGTKPAPATLAPPQVHFQRWTASGRAPDPERGGVDAGPFRFTVGPTAARPGEVMASVSVRRRDGQVFQRPTWLTIDADDPDHPDPMNDLEHYDVPSVDGGTAEARALLRSGSASRFTQFAWFSVSQSLPAVRLRARVWTLERVLPTGDLLFRPVAEADLGNWDLTILSRIRPQPVRE